MYYRTLYFLNLKNRQIEVAFNHFNVNIGDFIFKKYVGVQSWKALHLPTLDIRVKQKGNRALKWEIHVGVL